MSTAGTLSKEEKKALLKLLTYEKVNGKPIYYRNYKKVLKGELPPEAVMGSSGLQAYIIMLILEFLLKNLDKSKYTVLTNELGFLYKKGSWRNLDIAIFEKEKVKPYLMEDKLIPVAPKIVIEVDTKADLSRYGSVEEYAHEKTQDLLNAGVEKVIWIFTKTKKVMIAPRREKWVVQNWNEDFEVFEGIRLNIEELLKEEV
ncbi:MAG: Uma2 family endonuclease [Aquificae bacterium]|nr:Uma2 family endonuclease [Aquificota bacterium]